MAVETTSDISEIFTQGMNYNALTAEALPEVYAVHRLLNGKDYSTIKGRVSRVFLAMQILQKKGPGAGRLEAVTSWYSELIQYPQYMELVAEANQQIRTGITH